MENGMKCDFCGGELVDGHVCEKTSANFREVSRRIGSLIEDDISRQNYKQDFDWVHAQIQAILLRLEKLEIQNELPKHDIEGT